MKWKNNFQLDVFYAMRCEAAIYSNAFHAELLNVGVDELCTLRTRYLRNYLILVFIGPLKLKFQHRIRFPPSSRHIKMTSKVASDIYGVERRYGLQL